MKKQNVRTLSLIVCTFTYLLIGAAVFDALESENESKNAEVLQEMESMIMHRYGILSEDYRLLEIIVLKGAPHYAGKQWKFAGAFYYATTVLTTIGYGHSTPHTIGGKLFTMAYALVGIPLGLVMFQSIGERLNNFSSFVIRNVKRMLKYDNVEASETNLIFVVTTLSTVIIAGGAAAFSKYEGWTYFDSIYYCFVTLTTIGFGDMVALQQDNALTDKPEYVVFVLIFILFGLAIVAACLNLLVLRLVTLNTEDERRDEAEAVKAAQGAVHLDGDVITAKGSILSGQIPREQGGGSLINLDDSKSVCSCSCQCHRCLPWLPFSNSATKTRPVSSDFNYVNSRGTSGLTGFNRGYGALSSASFSVGSLGCVNETYSEMFSSERVNQEEYYELHAGESVGNRARTAGGVVYSSSMTSPNRIYQARGCAESPTPDRVLTRRFGGGNNFSLRGIARRLHHLRRQLFSNQPSRKRVMAAKHANRMRRNSSSVNKQRTVVQNTTPPEGTGFIDIPLDDNTFLNWSTSALSEKRASV